MIGCVIGCKIGCDHSNNELLVRYSSHDLNSELLVRYSDGGLNKEPFNDRTALNHLNTEFGIQIPTVLGGRDVLAHN